MPGRPMFINWKPTGPLPEQADDSMVPPAVFWKIRFPVGQYSSVGAHAPIRDFQMPGCLYSIGSQWIHYLPDQSYGPRWCRSDNFGTSVSQSGNILAVGASNGDTGGTNDTGATFFSIEANGSATYLTKSQADGAAGDKFGYSVSQSGNILAVGHTMPIQGFQMPGRLIFTNWKPMDPRLPHQSDRSRWCRRRQLRKIRFTVGHILAVGAHYADPGGLSNAGAAYLFQVEANGFATYLTKVTAPDGTATDYFGSSVSQSSNILAVGAYLANPGDFPMLGLLIFFNWKQWVHHLPEQGDRFR